MAPSLFRVVLEKIRETRQYRQMRLSTTRRSCLSCALVGWQVSFFPHIATFKRCSNFEMPHLVNSFNARGSTNTDLVADPNFQHYHSRRSSSFDYSRSSTFEPNPVFKVAEATTLEDQTSRSPNCVCVLDVPLYISVPRKISRPKSRQTSSRLGEAQKASALLSPITVTISPSSIGTTDSSNCNPHSGSADSDLGAVGETSTDYSSSGYYNVIHKSFDPTHRICTDRHHLLNHTNTSAGFEKPVKDHASREGAGALQLINTTRQGSHSCAHKKVPTTALVNGQRIVGLVGNNNNYNYNSTPARNHNPGLHHLQTQSQSQGSHYFSPGQSHANSSNTNNMPIPSPHASLNDLLNAQSSSPTRAQSSSSKNPSPGRDGGDVKVDVNMNVAAVNIMSSKLQQHQAKMKIPTSISISHRRRSTGENMGEQYAALQQTGSGNMMPPRPIPKNSGQVGGGSGGNIGIGGSSSQRVAPLTSVSPPQTRDPNHFFAPNQHNNHQRVLSCGAVPSAMQQQPETIVSPTNKTATTAINPFDDPAIIGDLTTPVLLTHQRSYDPSSQLPNPLTQANRTNSTGSMRDIVNGKSSDSNSPTAAQVSSTTATTAPAPAVTAPIPTSKSADANPFSQFDPLSDDNTSARNTLASASGGTMTMNSSLRSGYSSPPLPQADGQQLYLDTASLADIAAQLATLKPQKVEVSEEEKQLESKRNHIITLGGKPKESTGTNKTHRRFLSHQFKRKTQEDGIANEDGTGSAHSQGHRRTLSLNDSKDESGRGHRRALSGSFSFKKDDHGNGEKDGGRRSNPGSRPMTPTSKENRQKSNTNSSERPTTPGGSRRKLGLRLLGGDKDKDREKNSNLRTSLTNDGPELTTITSGEEMGTPLSISMSASMSVSSPTSPNAEIKLRSSEQDPTPHQVGIPPVSDILFKAKLCQMLENYRVVDQNFDYSSLVGMTRQQMEMHTRDGNMSGHSLLNSGSPPRNLNSPSTSPTTSEKKAFMQQPPNSLAPPLSYQPSQARLMAEHKPIISSLLEADDLILEGFYYDGYDGNSKSFDTAVEKSTMDRTELAIFKSDARRQFIVVCQGSAEAQLKPVKKGEHKDGIYRRFQLGNKDSDNRFSEEQNVVVFPPFRKAYFTPCNMEEKLFAKLDELAEENPFFDVITTGHSFGGVLAQLSGMRYANARPAIMVSCFAYGCPKIGDLDFRYYVNSLPNLKVSKVYFLNTTKMIYMIFPHRTTHHQHTDVPSIDYAA